MNNVFCPQDILSISCMYECLATFLNITDYVYEIHAKPGYCKSITFIRVIY